MREFLGAVALAFALVACIDGGFPLDSGETGVEQAGCCSYECSDGVPIECTVTSSASECESRAEVTCSSNGLDVSSVTFDESCGGECAR